MYSLNGALESHKLQLADMLIKKYQVLTQVVVHRGSNTTA